MPLTVSSLGSLLTGTWAKVNPGDLVETQHSLFASEISRYCPGVPSEVELLLGVRADAQKLLESTKASWR
jgi:hypothetical protein